MQAMPIGARIRTRCDGLGPYIGGAIALLALALLSLLLFLQSPEDKLLWTGQHVVGTEKGGIVYYRWHGQNYSLDVPGRYNNAPDVSVYLNPSDPTDARTNSALVRAADGMFLVFPVVLGTGIVLLGVRRRRRMDRRELAEAERRFGIGIDPEFVERHLQEYRRSP